MPAELFASLAPTPLAERLRPRALGDSSGTLFGNEWWADPENRITIQVWCGSPINCNNANEIYGPHIGGANFLMGDGAVRLVTPQISPSTFVALYTRAGGDSNMQNPWSGYPGYTSVQVEDFNRAGEDAWLLRAQYTFPKNRGLSMYALYVAGSAPDAASGYGRGETDFNLQWSPPEGTLKGLMVRLRYANVAQDDPGDLELFGQCAPGLRFHRRIVVAGDPHPFGRASQRGEHARGMGLEPLHAGRIMEVVA